MINPYNFVRSDKPMEKKRPNTNECLQGYNGLISCRLETRTPIFTPAATSLPTNRSTELRFFRINNRPALPGSSLKGMLRSLAEAISNGCSPFDDIHPRCRSLDNLCPVCRLFGYLKGKDVHAGQLCISDAIVEDGYELSNTCITLKELGSPKSNHYPFYEQAAQEHGRKFYYHQRHVRQAADIPAERNPTHRNVRIEPLIRGVFRFTVRYWNAGEVELGLLLHSLELPEGLYHKFGMAKPLGLGTVQISITGWKEYTPEPDNPASRYRQFDVESLSISTEGLDGDSLEQARHQLRQKIDFFKSAYAREYARVLRQPPTDNLWSLNTKNLEDLKIMLSEVPYSNEIHYPNFGWFNRHSQEKLPSAEEVHSGSRLPDE